MESVIAFQRSILDLLTRCQACETDFDDDGSKRDEMRIVLEFRDFIYDYFIYFTSV